MIKTLLHNLKNREANDKVRYDVLYIQFSKICVDKFISSDIIKTQEQMFLCFALLSLRGEVDG